MPDTTKPVIRVPGASALTLQLPVFNARKTWPCACNLLLLVHRPHHAQGTNELSGSWPKGAVLHGDWLAGWLNIRFATTLAMLRFWRATTESIVV